MQTGAASSRLEEHVGELRLVLEAPTLEEVFAEAARFVSRECGDVAGEPGEWECVELSAADPATLLVDWLNELIGRSEVAGRAYGHVRRLTLRESNAGWRVTAELRGQPVAIWESPLKAATYHGLELSRPPRGAGDRRADASWSATVLLDV